MDDSEPDSSKKKLGYALAFASLGVVFGDIGTSPLYALRECFHGAHALPITSGNVLGSVSLIFWFLVVIVSIKYSVFVMKADNKGEGGILALMVLVHRLGSSRFKQVGLISLLGIFGAAFLFSDGVLTPAISVLSAVEGLKDVNPLFAKLVIPIAIVILVCLFAIQSHGSNKIASIFSPIVSLWFVAMAIIGVVSIVEEPYIFHALNPYYAVSLVMHSGLKSLSILGTVFLAITGAEVLYADMGHFGKSPIRKAWFFLVFPSLFLNYFGQGAHLLHLGGSAENLFYQIVPQPFVIPMIIIATLATITASQAVISGAFSLFRQAVQLDFFPRMKIVHTSKENIGQVYVPFINIALFIVTLLLILNFKESTNLASAYGIANSATMLITTFFVMILANRIWKSPPVLTITIGVVFFIIDGSLFLSNLSKVMSGGWFILGVALAVIIIMTTWVTGRKLLREQVVAGALPIDLFIKDIDSSSSLMRMDKTAIFLSGNISTIPRALLHNYKHNGIIHNKTLLLSVLTEEIPFVPASERVKVQDFGSGLYGIVLRYGFMESPNLSKELSLLGKFNLPLDPMMCSYFLGKESIVLSSDKSMSLWRKQLFIFMARNAQNASVFFKLPPNRVVELGVQVQL